MHKRVTVHRLRHTAAMDLLQAGVDRSVIAPLALDPRASLEAGLFDR